MDPISKGVIPGLPFRQDGGTVSDGGTRLGDSESLPRGKFYMQLVPGEVEQVNEPSLESR